MAAQMTLEVAREILKRAYRHVLADYYFGDAEVWWTTQQDEGGKGVASGYKGSRGYSVAIDTCDGYAATVFRGAEAKELMYIGRHGSWTRNDECGDDRNCPL